MSSFIITLVVSCTLYVDALIIELFKSNNSGEGTDVQNMLEYWFSLTCILSILSLYGIIRVSRNPYSCIFQAVYTFKGLFLVCQGRRWEFLWLESHVNRLVKKFSIYWGQKKIMYDACHINGTWGSAEVGQLKLLYEDGKPQSGGPSVLRGDDSPRHHVLKKKRILFWILHFTLLRVIQGIKLK